MSTVTNTFSGKAVSGTVPITRDEKLQYSLTGSFTSCTLVLEYSGDGGQVWVPVKKLTATGSGVVEAHRNSGNVLYRFNCTVYGSGSPAITINKFAESSIDSGSITAPGVSVQEFGDKAVHKTIITLSSAQVDVTSVSTGNGVGGLKIYDFPEGYVHIHGCTANLSLAVLTEADFTDGTPEGDIGIGTVAPANADALGTDATDDNLATATAFTMTDYVDASVVLPPEASANYNGTSTPVDVYLNALVDAADIDDDTTGELLVSGTVTLVWSHLGDF